MVSFADTIHSALFWEHHRHTAGPVESEGVEMPKMSPIAKSRAASCSVLLCIIGHRAAVASGALKAPQGGTLWLILPTLFSWALLVKKQNQNTVKACLKDKCFALGYVQTANTLCITTGGAPSSSQNLVINFPHRLLFSSIIYCMINVDLIKAGKFYV